MGGRWRSWKMVDRVADMIELLIECHPQGFRVLLGEAPPPVNDEIHAMMNARRAREDAGVPQSSPNNTVEAERIVWDAESFAATVDDAGGWAHIAKICRAYRDAAPKMWAIVIDHASLVRNAISRLDESRLGYIARRHGVTKNTVLKYRREFPKGLASAILLSPADGNLRLYS